MTDQGIFFLVIILLTLITISLVNIWILLGENCCLSLLGLKGLNQDVARSGAGQAEYESLLPKELFSRFSKLCPYSNMLLFGQVLPIYGYKLNKTLLCSAFILVFVGKRSGYEYI